MDKSSDVERMFLHFDANVFIYRNEISFCITFVLHFQPLLCAFSLLALCKCGETLCYAQLPCKLSAGNSTARTFLTILCNRDQGTGSQDETVHVSNGRPSNGMRQRRDLGDAHVDGRRVCPTPTSGKQELQLVGVAFLACILQTPLHSRPSR